MLPVTALYAGLFAFGFIWLSIRVVTMRRRYHLALGASHRLVERAVRAHGNFSEYVPFALLLLALCEMNRLPDWGLHGLGVALLAGRASHAYGISREPEVLKWRVFGTSLTFTVIGVAGAALLGLAAAAI